MYRALKSLYLLVVFAALVGCSGNNDGNTCDGVVCDYGVCEPSSGECINASSCTGDEVCLEGYQCVAGGCLATSPCTEDGDCERGVCAADACVNAETCVDNTRCVEGFRCTSGSCEIDPCAGVDCPRGVCDPTSSACVNGEVCTRASEQDSCIDGYYCYGQRCELPETICDELACARGACDPQQQACVDAGACERDTDCLTGNYCGDDGTCQTNECDAQMRTCGRGVCEPASASCVNAENCGDPDECVDGYSCVEGSCVVAGEECGDGCPGNQNCIYVETDLVGVCDEDPTGCNQTVDCVQSRVCVGGACGPGTPCADDALEPNDSDATATRIADQPENNAVASLCRDDVDVFSFHTDDSELFRGELVVDLTIDSVDVGAGTLTIELVLPDGTTQSADTDAQGRARLAKTISVVDLGQYYVRVSGGADVLTSGVRYSIYTDMVDPSVVSACTDAIELGSSTISENTSTGDSFLLGSSCTTLDNSADENVYRFTLTEPRYVTISIDPAAGVDLAASIRSRCEVTDDIACANSNGAGGDETLAAQLVPGSYYVVVQGASATSGGDYDISFEAEPLVCTDADQTCVDNVTSRFCNGTGTDYQQVVCDSGCDMATGRCIRMTDDVCFTATDASGGINVNINWDEFTNDYDPGPNGCVPANSTSSQTNGPDAAYRVDVPDGSVLFANLEFDFGDAGVLYLVGDCTDLGSSCVASVNSGTSGADEELIYFNNSGGPQSFFLIADVQADSFGYNSSNLLVSVEPTICTAGSTRCMGDVQETCNALGTAWSGQFCSFGCSNDFCDPLTNDQCAGAIDLLANGPFTGRIDEYGADYNTSFSGCTSRSASGDDAAFSITPAAGDVATVSVTADFDVALWVVTDCASAAATCVTGADGNSLNDELVQFIGDGTTTYYVLVDSQSNGEGLFTVSAATQAPSCTPGTALNCLDATQLEYCTALGVPAPYTCQTTCSNAACDDPSGQVCADPIVLTSGQTVSNNYQFPNSVNPGEGTIGGCYFAPANDAQGADHIYAIDLTPGDWLFAEYTATTSYALMYLLDSCADTDTCLTNSQEGSSGSLVYEATQAERVYLVMDRTTSTQTSLSFDLTVEIARQDCTPNAPPFCRDGTTLEYCDSLGFTREYDCDGACIGTTCDMPTGDVCIDPIPLTSGQTVSGDWSGGTNTIQPSLPFDGSCEFDDIYAADGPEDVYRVDMFAGELLRAELDTTSSTAYVYILENCLDTTTCSDVNTLRGSGRAYHYATTSGPVYVVVDSSSTSTSTPYDLTVDVSAGAVCAPGSTTCDGGTLSICSPGGGFIESTSVCSNGCIAGRCAPDTGSDTCAAAPPTNGTVVYSSFDELTNDVEISSAGCTGGTGLGNDLVYAVSAGPGQVIHAWMQSFGSEDVQLYVATDCAAPDSSCVAGERGDSDDRAEVYFAPPTFGTYYLVAEATSSFSDEPFEFGVEIVAQECTPGAVTCTGTGQTLEYCNASGLYETYDCNGGCANDVCGTPTGQACFDAIPVAGGDSDSGVFNTENSINPGAATAGACMFTSSLEPVGADTIYTVDLLQDQILEVDYTSSSIYGMAYILTDCLDTNSCVATSQDGSSGTLQYTAPSDQTVFVVMDRSTSGSTTLGYTVDFQVLTPNCDAATTPPSCLDANTLQYCSGGFSQQYACGGTSGTCTNGTCDTPTADVCLDALPVSDGDSITDTFEGSNEQDLGSGLVGACDFGTDAQPGTDHFYTVALTAGQTLDLAYTSTSSYGIVMLLGDCDDAMSCIDNTGRGQTASLSYTATADETLYIVVDRSLSGSTSSYDYTLDVTIN